MHVKGLTKKSEVSLFYSDIYLGEFSYGRFPGQKIYFLASPRTNNKPFISLQMFSCERLRSQT